MVCPLCNHRKAKRLCPAKGVQICPVCCGTKRLVEINCPADCVYLASARSHPPAIIQRQMDYDHALILPVLQGLSERQARVFLMTATLISRHQSEPFHKLVDGDVAQAAEALAATLETAGRGIVYEHQPASLPAARLMAEMKTLVAEIAKAASAEVPGSASGIERDAAIGLRRIQEAARAAAQHDPQGTLFQELLVRVLAPPPGTTPAEDAAAPSAPASTLIIP